MSPFALRANTWHGQSSRPPFLAVRKGEAGEGRGSSQTPRLERAPPRSSGSKSFSPRRRGDTHEALTQLGNCAAHSAGCLLLNPFPEREFWVPPWWCWAPKVVNVSLTLEAQGGSYRKSHAGATWCLRPQRVRGSQAHWVRAAVSTQAMGGTLGASGMVPQLPSAGSPPRPCSRDSDSSLVSTWTLPTSGSLLTLTSVPLASHSW